MIEEKLVDALCQVGALRKDVDIDKIGLKRAVRMGMSDFAACNLVSLKMDCPNKDLVENLNRVLPNDICIYGKKKLPSKSKMI
jgi:tRNA U38,U39,U40 pseudouridine synthase TruA